MMTTTKTDQILALARSLKGHYSRPNKFITWYCDKRGYKGDWLVAPWCAMWVSFVARNAGSGADVGEFASCPAWVQWFKKHSRFGSKPVVGALAFFDWNGDGIADHVGIVSKIGASSIKTIEGNTRVQGTLNHVAEQTRKRSTVLGYGYPKYLDAPARVHVVAKGDTLVKIAQAYQTSWRRIYDANRSVIGKDPKLIKPGQRLSIS
jgi:LysM repeat protein